MKPTLRQHPTNPLTGNTSGLTGHLTGLRGDVTGMWGNVDACALTNADRKAGVDIAALVQSDQPATD